MKNMEREKFEESWKSAFDRAEIGPPEKVWTNIELDLEKAKGGDLRRRLMFYQMLAAASVVFAMAAGGVGYYSLNKDRTLDNHLAQKIQQPAGQSDPVLDAGAMEKGSTPSSAGASSIAENNSSTTENNVDTDTELVIQTDPFTELANRPGKSVVAGISNFGGKGNEATNVVSKIVAREEYTSTPVPLRIQDYQLSALHEPKEVQLTFQELEQKPVEVDPVIAMLAKLERREREIQSGENKNKKVGGEDENLWTSIGFAAGSYNTMQGPTRSNPMASSSNSAGLAAPIVDQESNATGYSYSMGMNVGTRIAARWVLQGGVNYLTHSSEYTANNMVMDRQGSSFMRFLPSATNELVHADESELSSKIVYSAPYNVNNNMRYLSIPMQAGYLIIDKTFGFQLNAGVATDLFLQNTVEGDGADLAKTSQPVGSDSPYRTVNLSGLFGTEFSYRFGQHYRISLNPGLRYPFNTIYKTEIGVQSTPLTFDVGLRFRYIFH